MEKAYIARQEVLDRNDKVVAYELLFRDHAHGIKDFPTNLKATSQVVMNALTNLKIEDLIPKNYKAYINTDETVLTSGIIDILDKSIFVLEILESADLTEKVIKKIVQYHKSGFEIAIDDFDCSVEMIKKFTPILKYISLIKVDVISANPENLKNVIPKLKKLGKKVLAEKVETEEEYDLYMKLGFDLFQGYYLSKPEVIEVNIHKEATHIVILQLISLLKEDAETSRVEKFVRSRPDLSFKLIKYLNNQNQFESEIDSITQVITLMGRERLMRWLLMYMYAEVATSPISEGVLLVAQKRAEQMEEAAPHHMRDKAYLAGMFSMMDILFQTDMKELMSHVKMDKDIVNLVTTKTGRFASSLEVIEKKEKKYLKNIVCEHFNELKIEDILYALEFAGVKLDI